MGRFDLSAVYKTMHCSGLAGSMVANEDDGWWESPGEHCAHHAEQGPGVLLLTQPLTCPFRIVLIMFLLTRSGQLSHLKGLCVS